MKNDLKKYVMTALFAALTCAATMAIRIPTPGTGGYIHPGDALVILSGVILGLLSDFWPRHRIRPVRPDRRIFPVCSHHLCHKGPGSSSVRADLSESIQKSETPLSGGSSRRCGRHSSGGRRLLPVRILHLRTGRRAGQCSRQPDPGSQRTHHLHGTLPHPHRHSGCKADDGGTPVTPGQ